MVTINSALLPPLSTLHSALCSHSALSTLHSALCSHSALSTLHSALYSPLGTRNSELCTSSPTQHSALSTQHSR
uniref:Uncharacterized protein n=1 Tax=Desertifilum tharense IPPAS B-1220 TaxID=1781255 RepID=A0ACD5H0I9_9CYAN